MTATAVEFPLHAAWPRPRLWLSVIAAATVCGVLEGAQGWFQYHDVAPQRFWPEAIARALPSWLFLALLFPVIYRVTRRFPMYGPHWQRSLPVHLVTGSVFVVLHLGGAAWVASLRQVTVQSFPDAMQMFVTRYLVTDYAVYGMIVGSIQVWHQCSEIRRRVAMEERLRTDLAEARLTALRHQLNPHFLFNTLNSISALAMTGDRDTMARAVDALSSLLRATLEEGVGGTTRLDAELAILDRYFEIQMIRFGDRLTLDRAIDPEALRAMVPPLILQPIVENAMMHGISARPGPGRVAVSARRVGDRLELAVEDSGPGFREGAAGAPRQGVGLAETPARQGVGLANTQARLQELYGNQGRLTCLNSPDGGGRVIITIPWTAAGDA